MSWLFERHVPLKNVWVSGALALGVALGLMLGAVGCRQEKDSTTAPEGAKKVVSSEQPAAKESTSQPVRPQPVRKAVPLPTEEELSKVGPIIEANRDLLKRLPDNLSAALLINPERFLQSPVGAEMQDVIDIFLSQMLGGRGQAVFPFPLTELKRIVICQKLEKRQAAMGQNYMPVYTSGDEIPLSFIFYHFANPKEDIAILSGMNQMGIAPHTIANMQPVLYGEIKLYTLIPETQERPDSAYIIIFNPQEAALVTGNKADIVNILEGKPGRGALAERLLRADLNKDFFGIVTDEGAVSDSSIIQQFYLLGTMMGAMMEFIPMPQSQEEAMKLQQDSLTIAELAKGVTFFLDVSAPAGASLLRFEVLARPGAQMEMKTFINDQIQTMQVRSAMQLQSQKQQQQPVTPQTDPERMAFLDSLIQGFVASETPNEVVVTLEKSNDFDQKFLATFSEIFSTIRVALNAEKVRNALQPISNALPLFVKENRRFPAWAIHSADGTPLLSWRVAILPQLGYKALYDQFNLNEPWDGPTNKPLLEQMPPMFASPVTPLPPGMTVFRMFGGPGTFQGDHPNGATLEEVANPHELFLFVTVKPEHAVEWTKPEFLEYTPESIINAVPPLCVSMMFNGEINIIDFTQFPRSFIDYFVSGRTNPEVEAAKAAQEERSRQMEEMIRRYQQQQGPPQQTPSGATPGSVPGDRPISDDPFNAIPTPVAP